MTNKERVELEARAQANHEEYAGLITQLLDMISDRDDEIEQLQSQIQDMESEEDDD